MIREKVLNEFFSPHVTANVTQEI